MLKFSLKMQHPLTFSMYLCYERVVNKLIIIQRTKAVAFNQFYYKFKIADNFAAKICSLLSQIRVHINIIIIQITSIKFDITLTALSFFIFSNVLPHDITKNPVKFCFSSQIFLENFQNRNWRQSIFSRRLGR